MRAPGLAGWAGLAGLAACTVAGCARFTWEMRTPDHRYVVSVRDRDHRTCVYIEDLPVGCYDGVGLHDLVFGGGGARLAYPAKVEGGWTVVRDGLPGRVWDGVASLVWSPHGEHLAYGALSGSGWCVVLDDAVQASWDSLIAGSLVFSPNGERIAYVAERNRRVHAVRDGVPGPAWDAVTLLRFSPDGSRLAYVAWKEFGARAVEDDAMGPPLDEISELVYSPDGRRLAYAAREADRWFVIVNGDPVGPYRTVRDLAFRPWDNALVFVAGVDGGEAVVVDKTAGPAFLSVQPPVFSEHGERWGYIAEAEDGFVIRLDGQDLAKEEEANSLALSPDGSRYVYVARRGGAPYVVDETTVSRFDLLLEGSLLFCADGRTWACLAGDWRKQRLFVVVEGRPERPPFDWEGVVKLMRPLHGRPDEAELSSVRVRDWVRAEAMLVLEGREGGG